MKQDDRHYSTVEEICNKIVQTFSSVSRTNNYNLGFQQVKLRREKDSLNFGVSNREVYNKPFTIQDLNSAVKSAKKTTSGQDKINYQMIKCLQDKARSYLLRVYNRLWQEHFFPAQWSHAVIIPIPKPGKPHDKSSNYRPIALTSCLCKTLERMINTRLVEYLDMHKIISKFQCGVNFNFNLVRLETAIRTAFAKNEHFVSVFYDLEKSLRSHMEIWDSAGFVQSGTTRKTSDVHREVRGK